MSRQCSLQAGALVRCYHRPPQSPALVRADAVPMPAPVPIPMPKSRPRPRARPPQPLATKLTHTDDRGRVHMVDVGAKPETSREAVAIADVKMSAATLRLVMGSGRSMGSAPRNQGTAARATTRARAVGSPEPTSAKGDVLATARIAAIAALKRTADLIPLCHPVRVVGTEVDLRPLRPGPGLRIEVTVRAFDRTGVEMEAMVGAAAAALTVYDMIKGVERAVEIASVRLQKKSGGRSGSWTRTSTPKQTKHGER